MRVALVSLGCPKNLVDSEKMLAILAQHGCVVGAPMEQAEAIVINTCGFLSAARDESLAVIRQAIKLKETGPARRVVVAGCLVNRDAQKLYDLVPGIDAIVGVNDRPAIAKAVLGRRRLSRITPHPPRAQLTPLAASKASDNDKSLQAGRLHHNTASANRKPPSDAGRFRLTPRHTTYLRISEGCNQRCTFCTIPAIRGPFRSKGVQAVLAEAEELLADGAIELNIIGQDTTTYGQDLLKPASLASLLRKLDGIVGPKRWIRLMYAYPQRFTDELIDVLTDSESLVKYIDLPLQHISDPILRRMGRGVGRASTEKLLYRLRERIPYLALRTTFIVGFPGETDGQFNELLQFVKDFKFDALGVFEFSPEPGTPAANMACPVADEVKALRAKQIMLVQQEIAFAANRSRKGSLLDVLVDGVDSTGRCVGRCYTQAPDIDSVCILSRPRPAGQLIKAKVTGHRGYDLLVQPLDARLFVHRKMLG